jgi:hypothetical protein
MKRKDIAVIAVVVIVSGILSFFLSRLIFDSPKNRNVQAEVVDPISTDFNSHLSTQYFNSNSINPTEDIVIGADSNGSPFNGQH